MRSYGQPHLLPQDLGAFEGATLAAVLRPARAPSGETPIAPFLLFAGQRITHLSEFASWQADMLHRK